MIRRLLLVATSAGMMAVTAQAQPAATPAPATPPASAPTKLTTGSPLKSLIENPATKAVLQKHVPNVLAHPQLQDVWSESLESVASYPEAEAAGLNVQSMRAIEADLAKL